MFNLNIVRKYSASIIFSHDIMAVILAWWIAFFVRYDFAYQALTVLTQGLPAQFLVILVHAFFYGYYKTYRPLWRFFSLPELMRLCKAVFFAWIFNISILFLLHDLMNIPYSIWFIYPAWLILILGSSRLMIRYIRDRQIASDKIKRVLIIGAGKGADLFLRELSHWPEKQYQPIGCLDDDVALKGKEIRGVPIFGSAELLPKIVQEKKIDLVVIAIPSIQTARLRAMVAMCEVILLPVKILPSLTEIAENHLISLQPRQISLEDLLGRDPVRLDWSHISTFLSQRVVLVSGGGGSIGSELCRQILKLQPEKLIILDHSEFNLYQIGHDLQKFEKNICLELSNVTDKIAMQALMQKYKPSVVFHAAAYKHVPLLESHIFQAVKNNILGTKILADAAAQQGVKKFIMVSTDKAVNPANVMGATKRIAEIFCQAYQTISKTAFITVRFGNVIGSAGSVIPLFQKQIQTGESITITHPNMTRYFMTIQEAAQLVLQAGVQGAGGEIFVLDMGKPIKIVDLAKHLISLSGKNAHDIKITFTGLRPGEKLFEELFYDTELLTTTQQKKIFKANVHSTLNWNVLLQALKSLEINFVEQNIMSLIKTMQMILGDEGKFLEEKLNASYYETVVVTRN